MKKHLRGFIEWFRTLEPDKRFGHLPPKGAVSAALIVLDRLADNCDFSLKSHLAKSQGQIAGTTPTNLGRILAEFGEERLFSKEAGRTNRGNPAIIEGMLDALRETGLEDLNKEHRRIAIEDMQRFLVDRVQEYFNQDRLKVEFHRLKPPWLVVKNILASAKERNQSGPVAQHLVGAKLEMRFPNADIPNYPASAADDQAGRSGDFQVGDTVFHVTVAPKESHCQQCAKNIDGGLAVFVIVPGGKVNAAIGLLENEEIADQLSVVSIESFVGQNVAEMSNFKIPNLTSEFGRLLQIYNRRVEDVESDKSILIEIPAALTPKD